MELTNKIENFKKNEMIRYPLASAARRICCKILDILFISLIVFGLGLAIFATEPGFDWHKLEASNQPWRYVVFAFLVLSIFNCLMLILPKLTNWTLAMKLLRMKYVNILPLSNFLWNLFKHELFIWEIMCLISFILGITLSCLPNELAKNLIYGVIVNKNVEITNWASYYGGVTFACFYYVSIIMLVVIFIGVCIKNKRPAFHDKFSNVLVVYLSPISKPDKQNNIRNRKSKRINYGIPGEINSGNFEEIDDLE